MIGRLRGIVELTGDGKCIVDVNGVGYCVSVSSRTMENALPAPRETTLIIETLMRAESLQLFGFIDEIEHSWFKILTNVQGVGPKVALVILSVASGDELHRAVIEQDKSVFAKAAGVGPKLATRLITELKSVVNKMPAPDLALPKSNSNKADIRDSLERDLVQVLEGLGFKRQEIVKVVPRTMDAHPDLSLEALLPILLQELT